MKKLFAVLMALSLVLVMLPVGAVAEAEEETYTLYAGQDMDVGTVTVTNDAEEICVTYALNEEALEEGWLIYETHLAVGEGLDDIPTNSQGNPVVGQFPYGDDELGGVKEWTKCISLDDLDVDSDELVIAAHAVIEKEECELVAEAPFGAIEVENSEQGVRKDGTDIGEGRSDPDAVLTWDTERAETDFFSLGFNFDEDEGGSIIVEFECCIPNGEGNDILVVEDTWGTYPLESADVYASKDGDSWEYLGEANNTTRDETYDWQTVSEFDLGDLECARYIKVVDTTPIAEMPDEGDGFDLNTIQALQDCYDCTTYDETAWGEGERFVDKGNWATYMTYEVQEVEVMLESVVYEGEGAEFGTAADETLTLTFSGDVFLDGDDQVEAKTYVHFQDADSLGYSTAHMEYVAEDKEIVITSLQDFNDPRPETGDFVVAVEGIVDADGDPVFVPGEGVEIETP